jgi:hypothetical protein
MPLDRSAGCTVNRIDGIAEEAMARELLRVDEITAILPDTPLRIAALVEGRPPSRRSAASGRSCLPFSSRLR